MAVKFRLADGSQKPSYLSDTLSVNQALTKLDSDGGSMFIMINAARQPQAVLKSKYLKSIPKRKRRRIGMLAKREQPPLLTIDAEVGSLGIKNLKMFKRVLDRTKSPGFAVMHKRRVVGAISRSDISHAILGNRIITITGGRRRMGGGGPDCPYVCRKCASRRWPSDCDTAPFCPRNPEHGEMDPE